MKLKFEKQQHGRKEFDKTSDYVNVYNSHDEELGFIYFKPAWKEFVFEQNEDIMSTSCLIQLVAYMESLK